MNLFNFIHSIIDQEIPMKTMWDKDSFDSWKNRHGYLTDCNQFQVSIDGTHIGGLVFGFDSDIYVACHLYLGQFISFRQAEKKKDFMWTGLPTRYTFHIPKVSPYTQYMLIKEKYQEIMALGKKYYDIDYKSYKERIHKHGLYAGCIEFEDVEDTIKERKTEADAIVRDFKKAFYKKYPYMKEYDANWCKLSRSSKYHHFMRDDFILSEMGLSFNEMEEFCIDTYGTPR